MTQNITWKTGVTRQCPNCGKIYVPVLKRENPHLTIQNEFPDAPAWQREQHLSACCSHKCYIDFIGLGEGEE
jgi:hypothetical protein